MTNLLTVLPNFDLAPFTHILPPLERALVSAADLLTLDAYDVAKRAQVPPGEVKKLADALLSALRAMPVSRLPTKDEAKPIVPPVLWQDGRISTLDDDIDAATGGGVSLGHLTEVVGESAAGKTQFLLTLLLSAQLAESNEQRGSALYISTEAPLQTTRLAQILATHPKLSTLPSDQRPSLDRVQSGRAHDVESQEHILRYQLPVAIEQHNVRLVVVDSIAANYRAEFDNKGGEAKKTAGSLAKRNVQLADVGSLLRKMAQTYNIAIVVANQVADRFTDQGQGLRVLSQATQSVRSGSQLPRTESLPPTAQLPSDSTSTNLLSTDDPLALDHQQRFFTGWGDDVAVTNLKTPSLGLAWTNQLSTRIALLKDPIYDEVHRPGAEREVIGWQRSCKVVFSAWCAPSLTKFEIWAGGVRSLQIEQPQDIGHPRP